jgi:hypothetical protein
MELSKDQESFFVLFLEAITRCTSIELFKSVMSTFKSIEYKLKTHPHEYEV